ncbi:MAG: hypothetical protein AAF608_00495 [Pseudomonadota bacterium]
MAPLALLLITKIVVTGLLVGIPFLLLPAAVIGRLSGFEARPPALYRLYGMAIIALLVGYGGGLVEVLDGSFPWGVAAMGIVSNGGAAIVLVLTGQAGTRRMLTAFFVAITAGLVYAAAMPEAAVRPL